jgi:hypothetical protein
VADPHARNGTSQGAAPGRVTKAAAQKAAPAVRQSETAPIQKQAQPVQADPLPPGGKTAARAAAGAEPVPRAGAEEKAKPREIGKPQPDPAASMAQAQEYFASGDFTRAGDLWRQELITTRIRYSILLEMDCLKASVRIAFRQATDRDNFFVLNKTSRDGRHCWLALWGRYRTQDEAALGLKLIPQYFWKQSEPPSVVELQPYL